MSGHLRVECSSCGVVIRRCRCPGMVTTTFELCDKCANALQKTVPPVVEPEVYNPETLPTPVGVYSAGGKTWSLARLVEAARGLPIERVPLSAIPEWSMLLEDALGHMTVAAFAKHVDAVMEVGSDFPYPIILAPGGTVLDSVHRLVRWSMEYTSAPRVVRLKEMPLDDAAFDEECRQRDLATGALASPNWKWQPGLAVQYVGVPNGDLQLGVYAVVHRKLVVAVSDKLTGINGLGLGIIDYGGLCASRMNVYPGDYMLDVTHIPTRLYAESIIKADADKYAPKDTVTPEQP